jgi:integrase
MSLTPDRVQNKEIYRLAEICRSKRETQLLTGAWDIQDPIAGKVKLIDYMADCAKHHPNTRKLKSCINHVKKFQGGSLILITQVSSKWLDGFQFYLLNDAGISQTSAATYSKALRGVLKKAMANNIIIRDPSAAVKRIQTLEGDIVFLNIDELQRMAAVHITDPRGAEVRRAFLFACYTGLRVSDLETLTWGRVETSPMQIIKSQEKTKSPAYIPLSKSAQKLIVDGVEHDPEDKVFALLCVDRRPGYKVLKAWAKDAGVKKNVTWHTSRRTFATMALENGVDIYTVAKLLGHRGISQVMRYAKVTDKLRREAVAALPEIDV